MKEAEEALSSSALASTWVPSGALTWTRQVISNEFDFKSVLVWEEMTSSSEATVTGVELTASVSGGITAGLEEILRERSIWRSEW